MLFSESPISGAYIIDIEKIGDHRGFFARAWCEEEAEEHGLSVSFVQANISYNEGAGTLRGLHYQLPPHQEAKLIRCTKGAVFDVIVDLRKDSPTYREWFGIELSEENRKSLFVPTGCAHGYQTLEAHSEVFYPVSACYAPEAARGVRYDDPAFGIEWPREVTAISEKDESWPPFSEIAVE